jgi:hypothetical protein
LEGCHFSSQSGKFSQAVKMQKKCWCRFSIWKVMHYKEWQRRENIFCFSCSDDWQARMGLETTPHKSWSRWRMEETEGRTVALIVWWFA